MKQNIATTWRIGEATVTEIEELLGPAFRPQETARDLGFLRFLKRMDDT
jgi:hypothetical protein